MKVMAFMEKVMTLRPGNPSNIDFLSKTNAEPISW